MALPAGDPLWYYKVIGLHCDGTNGSTTFTDVTGKTVTANGNAQISTAQYPSLTGKTSSGYLDGTGDYLSVPDSADWSFGTGNFTVKARVRFDSSNPSYQTIASQYNTTSNWWFLRKEENTNNKLTTYFRTGGTVMANYIMTSSWSSWAADTWYEIELVRSGSSIYIFIDGVSQTLTATVAVSTNNVGDVSSPLYVGSDTTYPLKGYISEVEIYKGVALHTANFTPSSDPFPDTYVRISGTAQDADGNFASRLVRVYRRDTGALAGQAVSDATTGEYAVTAVNSGTTTPLKHVAYMHTTENGAHVPWRVLGLHCDGTNTSTTFTDVKGKTVTAVGNAQISTAQYPSLTGKTSSGYVDGTGDYLTIPDSADWDFGTGAFTVRIRARFSGVTTAQALVSNYLNSGTGFSLVFDGVNSKLQFLNGTTALLDVAWSPSTNTWYDIEVSRYGTSLRGFVGGTQVGATATNSTNITGSTSTLFIGARDSTNQLFTGYFSEVEIYKGVALHTANFTSLTVPFYDAIGTATDNAVIFDDITPY